MRESSFKVNLHLSWDDRESVLSSALEWISAVALKSFAGLNEGCVVDESLSEFDVGEPARDRDWIKTKKISEDLSFFFSDEGEAIKFAKKFESYSAEVSEVAFEDWNAKWRQSFLGVDLSDFWAVRPSWNLAAPSDRKLIRLDPSFGFGFGNHPTTALCLDFLARIGTLESKSVLDFGSGSGILSVAAALLGAEKVYAVEIDPIAREASLQCLRDNGVENLIEMSANIQAGTKVDLVMANIISSVILENLSILLGSLRLQSEIIFSGILASEEVEFLTKLKEIMTEEEWTIHDQQRREKDGWLSFYYSLRKI